MSQDSADMLIILTVVGFVALILLSVRVSERRDR